MGRPTWLVEEHQKHLACRERLWVREGLLRTQHWSIPTGPLPLLWLPALHCKALNTEDKYILERFANGEGAGTLQVKIELLLMGWRFILC